MTDINNKEIITRSQALARGLKRYFTGKPCSRSGHIAERNAQYGRCVECNRDNLTKLRNEDNDKYKSYQKKHKQNQLKLSLAWRARNPDKVKEYKKQEMKRNKSTYAKYRKLNKEKIKISKKAWCRANPNKVRQMKKRDYEKNRKKRLKSALEWHRKNPELAASYCRNRKARVRSAKGSHTKNDISILLKQQKNKCAECRCKIAITPMDGDKKVHVDHIMPIVLGGSNDRKNLQCLCPSCNLSKGALHPNEWAKRNNRLI